MFGFKSPSLGVTKQYTNEQIIQKATNSPTRDISFDGGIYSVGNDVVNGQVSDIVVKGLTATNLVKNGSFADGMLGWGFTTSAPVIVDGRAYFNREADGALISLSQNVFDINNKYYVSFDLDKIIDNATSTYGFGTPASIKINFRNVPIGRSKQSILFQPDRITAYFNTNIGGTEYYIDNVLIVDLTATFGAGNEPTKEQCDAMFPHWFDGTKSTLPVTVKSVGKNLFDESKLESVNSHSNLVWDGKVLSLYGYANSLSYDHSFVKYVRSLLKVGHTYTSTRTVEILNGDSGQFGAVRFYNATYGSFEIFAQGDGDRKRTFTVPEDFFEKWGTSPLYIYGTQNGTGERIRISRLQIEESSTDTPYEPYKESSVIINLPEPLRSVPSAKDEVNVTSGVKTQNVSKEYILTTDLAASTYTYTDSTYGFIAGQAVGKGYFPDAVTDTRNSIRAICADGDFSSVNTALIDSRNIRISTTNNRVYIRVEKSKIDAMVGESILEKGRNYFTLYPVTLTYQLAEPIVTKLPTQAPLQVFENGTVYVEPMGDPAESTVPSVEMTIPTGTSNKFGVATHDYGGAAADWELTNSESKCFLLAVSSAGGSANIIAPNRPGTMYAISNASGYAITIKKSGGNGVAVTNAKTVLVIHNGTDYTALTAEL